MYYLAYYRKSSLTPAVVNDMRDERLVWSQIMKIPVVHMKGLLL